MDSDAQQLLLISIPIHYFNYLYPLLWQVFLDEINTFRKHKCDSGSCLRFKLWSNATLQLLKVLNSFSQNYMYFIESFYQKKLNVIFIDYTVGTAMLFWFANPVKLYTRAFYQPNEPLNIFSMNQNNVISRILGHWFYVTFAYIGRWAVIKTHAIMTSFLSFALNGTSVFVSVVSISAFQNWNDSNQQRWMRHVLQSR